MGTDLRIKGWTQLCQALAAGVLQLPPFLADRHEVKMCLEKGSVLVVDYAEGYCSEYEDTSLMPFLSASEKRVRTLSRSYFVALMPSTLSDRLQTESQNVHYRIFSYDDSRKAEDAMTEEDDTLTDYVTLTALQAQNEVGQTREIIDDVIEPIVIQRDYLNEVLQGVIASSQNAILMNALEQDMARLNLKWVILYGSVCDGRSLITEMLNVMDTVEVMDEEMPEDSFVSLPVYYLNAFVTITQLQKPTRSGRLGELLVKQIQDQKQYIIRYIVDGNNDVIEKVYEEDRKTKQMYGRIYDRKNKKFMGLIEEV